MFFLCGGPLPACPNGQGMVTGTVTAANIYRPNGEGVAPGEFQEAIDAVGPAYANVHTVTYPSREIRGHMRQSNSQRDLQH